VFFPTNKFVIVKWKIIINCILIAASEQTGSTKCMQFIICCDFFYIANLKGFLFLDLPLLTQNTV